MMSWTSSRTRPPWVRPQVKTPGTISLPTSACWAPRVRASSPMSCAHRRWPPSSRWARPQDACASSPTTSFCVRIDTHMYELLDAIQSPAELRQLDRKALPRLADELRQFLLESLAATGGHLSSNLGTVELTVALHYVFDTP